MKVREDMRIKQAVYGSTRAPAFVNGDARKWHSSHQSLEAPHPKRLFTTHSRSLVICHDWIMDDHVHAKNVMMRAFL